jgi:hypothetical protein
MKIEITPESVKAAYDKFPDIKPTQHVFKEEISAGTWCVCALTILAVDHYGMEVLEEDSKGTIPYVCSITSYTEDELWDFTRGFDCENYEDFSLQKTDSFCKHKNMLALGYETKKSVFGEENK